MIPRRIRREVMVKTQWRDERGEMDGGDEKAEAWMRAEYDERGGIK